MKRKYTVTDKVREQNRLNAKKPRGPRLTENLREVMAQKLVPLLMGPGAERIGQMLTNPKAPYEEFRWASEFVSNRLGLPALTQQQVDVKGAGQREVVVLKGGAGWLGESGGKDAPIAAGDHDDRSEQPTVQ